MENALSSKNSYPKIDIHTHILPENWPNLSQKYGYGGFVHLEHHKTGCARLMIDGKFFREIHANCWNPEIRIKECNHHRVDVQVLSTVPVMFSYWAKPADALDLSRFLNDHIAGVVATYPKRFVGLGTVPMQAPNLAIKEMERCVKELGLAGIEIGTNVNGRNLNEPEFFPIFQAAEELGAALLCIRGIRWDRNERKILALVAGRHAGRNLLGNLRDALRRHLRALPKLRVAFAHGGGSFPVTIGRIEHGFQARPDLCAVDNEVNPREYLGRFYLDSLVHDPAILKYLIDLIGENRLALGSDYPFPLGEAEPGKLIESMPDLSEATKARLLAGTALEWLGLKKNHGTHKN
jgi:aminocarboxymuconate-semialdehyde decarboxylase